MRRRTFLVGLGACAGFSGVFVRGNSAAAQRLITQALPTNVRVRLFSGLRVVSLDLTGSQAITRAYGNVASSAASFTAGATNDPATFSSKAPIAVTAHLDDGTSISRTYAGDISTDAGDGAMRLVNTVDLESYVASVLASEISAGWHPETLRAQAIAVRTYAARRCTRPNTAFDVTDDTSNQVYHGVGRIAPSLASAAADTIGKALIYDGEFADVWYHSACGGHTAAVVEVTAAPTVVPYLQGVADAPPGGNPYCAISPYFRWRNVVPASALVRAYPDNTSALDSLSVLAKWPDGRVRSVKAAFTDGTSRTDDGHAFYERALVALGYKVLPSAMFDISAAAPESFEFSGQGVGHGVGMCQWGAEGRARAGQTAEEILGAYFPGISLAKWTTSLVM